MLWIILSCAVAFVVAVWVTFRISNRHAVRLCRAIPSAQPCYPVLGNILIAIINKKSVRKILEETLHRGERAMCFWAGPYPFVIVTNPEDVKKVLNNSVCRGEEMEESSKEYSKYGLVTSPVDHWKVTRRHLNLSFHPRNLEDLMPTFNSTSRQLVADLSKYVDGAVFNIMPEVTSTALRSVCTFLYGQKTMDNVSTEQFEDLKHAVELIGDLTVYRLCRPWLYNGFVFKLLYGKEINTIKTALRSVFQTANTYSVKRKLSKDQEEYSTAGDSKCAETQYGFQTILDAMRELQGSFSSVTDRHVMEEMVSFYAAGTDTIAVTVSSCLLALARFPHVQDKVYEEIYSVLSEDDEQDISHSDLKRLPYLDQVIKETLRFFPAIPFCVRSPSRDMDLGGYTIPANKLTFIWIASMFFDPKYFPDPRKFDPDRFSTPNSSEDVFIPFSRGPRNCIGKEYAMLLMKVMVAQVVRKYRLSTNMDVQNLKKKLKVTAVSRDGYNVYLRKRNE